MTPARQSLRSYLPPLVSAVLVASLTTVTPARADDATCYAASEREINLRKEGKLREARDQLVICAAPTCPADVSAECGRRIGVLNAALPTVILSATDASGNDALAVTVAIDGAPFATKLDGLALPIDPGSHTLTFTIAGKPPIDKTVLIREGEKDRHINVALAAPAQSSPPSRWTTQKTLALASAGVGVVGLGVGTAFGVIAGSDASTAKNDCPAATCTVAGRVSALSEHSSATTAGNVSTALFIVGGVGVAAGVVLWLTSPTAEKPPPATAPAVSRLHLTPSFTPLGGSMMLSGDFQ